MPRGQVGIRRTKSLDSLEATGLWRRPPLYPEANTGFEVLSFGRHIVFALQLLVHWNIMISDCAGGPGPGAGGSHQHRHRPQTVHHSERGFHRRDTSWESRGAGLSFAAHRTQGEILQTQQRPAEEKVKGNRVVHMNGAKNSEWCSICDGVFDLRFKCIWESRICKMYFARWRGAMGGPLSRRWGPLPCSPVHQPNPKIRRAQQSPRFLLASR